MQTPKVKTCKSLRCTAALEGSQRDYCSNRCKQTVKYAVKKGEQCGACSKVIKKPVPVMGGFKSTCDRKRCPSNQS